MKVKQNKGPKKLETSGKTATIFHVETNDFQRKIKNCITRGMQKKSNSLGEEGIKFGCLTDMETKQDARGMQHGYGNGNKRTCDRDKSITLLNTTYNINRGINYKQSQVNTKQVKYNREELHLIFIDF